jgi:toxin secretion/phage lysis holin
MEETIITKSNITVALMAMGGFLASLLGGWDVALRALVTLMAADFITGLMIAAFWKRSNKSKTGALTSKASFKGLCKKVGILFAVLVGVNVDAITGDNYVRTLMITFFIGNEGLSVLENLALMGVPYHPGLKKMLEVMKDKNTDTKQINQTASELSKERGVKLK